MGTAAGILLLLYFLLERTLLGKAVRACAINRQAAQLMGIGPGQMSLLAFALSAALGAVGGIVIAPLTLVSYDMGLMLGLKGFVAAVIGGLVSAPGAVIGGLLLGVLESLAAGLISSGLKDAIAFLALVIVIFARSEQPLLRRPWKRTRP
jgi:branched-chain amino acid transport system permease protein